MFEAQVETDQAALSTSVQEISADDMDACFDGPRIEQNSISGYRLGFLFSLCATFVDPRTQASVLVHQLASGVTGSLGMRLDCISGGSLNPPSQTIRSATTSIVGYWSR